MPRCRRGTMARVGAVGVCCSPARRRDPGPCLSDVAHRVVSFLVLVESVPIAVPFLNFPSSTNPR